METMTTILGSIGLALLLSAFVLNQLHRLSPDSISYNVLNIVGGILLTFYAWILSSIPFLILESVWATFALYRLLQLLNQRRG
jgi:hypothetical protein